MNSSGINGIGSKIKLYYDKIIVVVMLLGLVFSLVYLAVKIGMIRKDQEQHQQKMSSFVPKYPDAVSLDSKPYKQALEKLRNPFQLVAWTNAIFVPQDRVWCIDCRMPIHYSAKICTYCTAKQPLDPGDNPLYDFDKDGIPDLWEVLNKMDPADPTDIHNDNDNDGFSNIVEFNADPHTDLMDLKKKHGTGINDPKDFPPPINLLVVDGIGGTPFNLRFKAKTKMPDGSLKFQINLRGNKTIMAKLGDTVGGFKLIDYKENIVKEDTGTMLTKVDKSILTVQRGKKKIRLMKNQRVPYTEYVAKLRFTLDDTIIDVKPDKIFELKGTKYRVKAIDKGKTNVVVIRTNDGKKFILGAGSE
jgi:hypothetical protein